MSTLHTVQTVWVVMKNADCVTSYGPMVLQNIFVNKKTAVEYVSGKKGTYGTARTKGEPKSNGYISFNGYDIRPMPLITDEVYARMADAKAELEKVNLQMADLIIKQQSLKNLVK